MRRRGGRCVGAYIVGRSAGVRSDVSPTADVRGRCFGCHTLGARRLRTAVAGQTRAARYRHRVQPGTGTAVAVAATRQSTKETYGEVSDGQRRRPPPFPDQNHSHRRRFTTVRLPNSSLAT